MNRVTRLVLKRPVTTLLAVLALVVFGFSSLTTLRLELMPDMEMPMKIVYTVYPGADSESVDDLVTTPIEDKVGSLSGVKSITSSSMENVSMVLLQYDYDQNVNDAYLDLRAALDQVKSDLPDDSQDPMIIEMNMDSMPSITYSVSTSDGTDALAFANQDVVPELEALSSVAQVTVSGGQEQYIKVELDRNALSQYGLNMNSIAQYIKATDFTIPLGNLEQGSQSISAISTSDNDTVQAIRDIPLYTATGSVIHLSDVADVDWSVKDADSIARFNGEDTVTISMTKNQSASTIGMVNDVKKVMKNISEQNENAVIEASYDASEMIFESLSSVGSTLALGVILSMIVLYIFLGDWKASRMIDADLAAHEGDRYGFDGLLSEHYDAGWSGHRYRYDGRQLQCRDRELFPCKRSGARFQRGSTAGYHRSDFFYCGIHYHNGCCISAAVLLWWNDRTDLYAVGTDYCVLTGSFVDLRNYACAAVL